MTPSEKIQKAGKATDDIQEQVDEALRALKEFNGNIVNGFGVYMDVSRQRAALADAKRALDEAQRIMRKSTGRPRRTTMRNSERSPEASDPMVQKQESLARLWITTGQKPDEANLLSTSQAITVALAAGHLEDEAVTEHGLEWSWKQLDQAQCNVIERCNPVDHTAWSRRFGSNV
jgi:hypothetical protein